MARSLGSEPKSGDNSAGMIDGAAARGFIDRAKNLLDQRDEVTADLKEVYAEAKEAGFVTARLRHRVKEERMDQGVLAAQRAYDAALDAALTQLVGTPLADAAKRHTSIMPAHEGKPGRKPKAQTAIEAAQAHLDSGGDFEDAGALVDADHVKSVKLQTPVGVQRIIDEHPSTVEPANARHPSP